MSKILISNASLQGGQGKTTLLHTIATELCHRNYPCVIRDVDTGSKSTLAMQRHKLPYNIIGVSEPRSDDVINLLDTPSNYINTDPKAALRYYNSSQIILNCVSGGEASVANAITMLSHLYALEMTTAATGSRKKLISKVITVFTRNSAYEACHQFRLHSPQLGQNINAFFALPFEEALEESHAHGNIFNAPDSDHPKKYAQTVAELVDLIEKMARLKQALSEAA